VKQHLCLSEMSKNTCWRLRSRPVGEISDKDLELCVEDMPVASASGEMLIKNLFVSIDPTHRIWMSDRAQYMPPVALGEVMRAATVGVVVNSNDAAFAPGQHVVGFGGLSQHYVGVSGQNV
jgi:NADPH-dependent curcumin reductase CurA